MNYKIKSAVLVSNALKYCCKGISAALLLAFLAMTLLAQNPSSSPKSNPAATPSLEKQFFKNIVSDQTKIWTSPFRLRAKDAKWLIPFGAATTALIAADRRTSAKVSRRGSLPAISRNVSQGGAFYTAGGIAAGFYLIGRATKNTRAKETGLLAAEALIDSGIATQGLKFAAQRPRPNADNGRGRFFKGGNSFPSGHAASIWAVAAVIASEYKDRPLIRYGAFAAATAISLSRYSGRNHFLSDVLVGSAIGFGIGRFVYKTRHVQTNDQLSPKITKLVPTIAPVYERKTRTFGGTLTWFF